MSVTISGSGQIIKQVVQTVVTTPVVFSGYSPGSWVNVSGVVASITPTNSSNKILVQFSTITGANANGNYGILFRVTRNGTAIGVGDARGSAVQVGTYAVSPYSNYAVPTSYTYLDSPATTSAVTYQIQGCAESGIETYVGGSQGTGAAYTSTGPIVITVYEVAYA